MKPFEVGQRVTAFGLVGTVEEINGNSILVKWEGGEKEVFGITGKLWSHHKEPSLKHTMTRKEMEDIDTIVDYACDRNGQIVHSNCCPCPACCRNREPSLKHVKENQTYVKWQNIKWVSASSKVCEKCGSFYEEVKVSEKKKKMVFPVLFVPNMVTRPHDYTVSVEHFESEHEAMEWAKDSGRVFIRLLTDRGVEVEE